MPSRTAGLFTLFTCKLVSGMRTEILIRGIFRLLLTCTEMYRSVAVQCAKLMLKSAQASALRIACTFRLQADLRDVWILFTEIQFHALVSSKDA